MTAIPNTLGPGENHTSVSRFVTSIVGTFNTSLKAFHQLHFVVIRKVKMLIKNTYYLQR